MTEFKQGDRVRYNGGYAEWHDKKSIGATGTVVAYDRVSTNVRWDDELPDGVRKPPSGVYNDNLELVAKPAVKVGDRVLVHEAIAIVYNGDPAVPATVDRIGTGGQAGRILVSTDKKVRGVTDFWAEAWSVLVEEPPKVGDKVRVVYEGTVAYADAGSHITVELENGGRKALPKNRVEVLERAPKAYPVGTAVRYKTPGVAYPLLRDRDGWRNHGGELASSVTDARIRAGEFEVIYEPPQSA